METFTFQFSVRINGKYTRQIVQLQLKRDYEGEQPSELIWIKYGKMNRFLPSSAYLSPTDLVAISAVGVGQFADIRLTPKEWIDALVRIGSVEKLKEWREKFNQNKLRSNEKSELQQN